MSILTVFILVLTLAKGIKLQCNNCEIQLSNKSYTSLPIGQICQSFDAKSLIAVNNNISSLRNLRNLSCLTSLKAIDLSHNLITLDIESDDLDQLNFTGIIEQIDLSFNSIEFLNTSLFLTRNNKTRFPKLSVFKINNNRLKCFDLLIPLSLPNPSLIFDASNNKIQMLKNILRKSFRENPFYSDFSNENRTINLLNNQIKVFGHETLCEYNVEKPSDLEIFLTRMSFLNIMDQKLMCQCPAFFYKSVYLFRQINNQSIDHSALIYQQKCSNIAQNPLVLDYTCGVFI